MYSAQYGGRSGRAKGKTSKPKREKCVRCGAKGHLIEACTKPVREGEEEEEMEKLRMAQTAKNSGGAGSGISHKTSRAAGAKSKEGGGGSGGGGGGGGGGKQKEGGSGAGGADHQSIPSPFINQNPDQVLTAADKEQAEETDTDWFEVWDAGCDVGASLDALSASLGSAKKAMTAYQAAMSTAQLQHYKPVRCVYGGCICRITLKPNKPFKANSERCQFILLADPHTYFCLGLGPGFCDYATPVKDGTAKDDDSDDDDDDDDDDSEEEEKDEQETAKQQFQEAVSALTEAMDGRVVGVWAKLDYNSTILERPGNDRETQLRRFRATCTAALQCQVPVQVRLTPGADEENGAGASASASASDANKTSGKVSLSPYLQGVKDLAKVLLEFTDLKVHISCWSGTSEHMAKLLQAFPDTLYIGLTAATGFAKANIAHEVAFDVPLSKLILETDTVIPAPVVMALGRKAFAHSGAVGFCAQAVAKQKKIPPKQVARMASLNTVQLYGRELVIRSKQAAEEAAALEAERVIALAEEEQEELVVAEIATQQEEDEEAPAQTKKQKKKNKKKKGGQQQQEGEDADQNFDDEYLATLIDEKM